MWEKDLLVGEGKSAEPAYRQRLLRFMRYARRWYALATDTGFGAYFPFRYFEKYMQALSSPVEKIREEIPILIKGLQ